ncbi:cytochrome P450 [Aspergillus clavatus NRRL 1]|uniref:Benzoate 4-monooxygenase cytochrome P450 n=1 Tax=Aspergillus clavatus (strain ATCC 1007 / CBS 513.65 / DSM 816 / NCTC 3887 / NRRL 1 / QM 1276 / 107) TaxID=344612 RepID=A1CGJ7_ASPCL|nr:benzoate 4-monooxygenase cytochrome P450 [Aspergillus clavatus NRRL 1]EAW11077.1 benzoate 4-monooxygenase cytochrome P450 [Aspergillus clavatus NRRL 1]
MESYMVKSFLLGVSLSLLYLIGKVFINLFQSPLRSIPGPKLFAITKWRLAYEDYRGTRTRYMKTLHDRYGDAVRIGPNEVSFNSLSALRTIYGAGTVFQRDTFYRMFDAYGKQVMFSFASSKDHRARKKLLNHAYSKTSVLSPNNASMIEEKARQFMDLIEKEAKDGSLEIFAALHYFSIDAITKFLYGKSAGATTALTASQDRSLLDDILDPDRRKLSWFTIHFPTLTNWLYSRTGLLESLLTDLGLLPMRKPSTYTGIRAHALAAAEHLSQSTTESLDVNASIAERLLVAGRTADPKGVPMDHLDVASECADHLLAGIDTTSDTSMWAMFALSQPENQIFQDKLRAEVRSLGEEVTTDRVVSAIAADKQPYLDAVIKETLRLFAPLPGTEPRFADTDQIIDGYSIPKGTVVSMSPYTLHRNARVFQDPTRFNPDRWLGDAEAVAEMKRWFWAFSSGGRMCIGMHLAMAEMTTLLASVYRTYKTEITPGFEGVSPGVTARYEVFSDEQFPRMEEHVCWVKFVKE